jgi:hypothetical protein
VDHDELLRRLDAHMERGNEIMARSDLTMRRSDLTMRRSDLTMRRSNEVMLRNEVAFRDLREFLAEQTLAMQGLTREISGLGSGMAKWADEILEEGRSHRRALFRILDRLDGNGGPAAGEAS